MTALVLLVYGLLFFLLNRFDAGIAPTVGHWKIMPVSVGVPAVFLLAFCWNWFRGGSVGVPSTLKVLHRAWLTWIVVTVFSTAAMGLEWSRWVPALELVLWTAVFWIITTMGLPKTTALRYIRVFVVFAALAGLISLAPVAMAVPLKALLTWDKTHLGGRAFLPLGVATAIADAYLLAFPAAVAWIVTAKTRLLKWSGIVLALAIGAGILLTFSRGAVGLAVVQLIVFVLVGVQQFWFRKQTALILVVLCGLLGGLTASHSPETDRLTSTWDASIMWRVRGWRSAVSMIQDRPFLGHGVENHFRRQEGTHECRLFPGGAVDSILYDYRYSPREPHNAYLLTASETGLLGAFLFFSLPFGLLVLVGRRLKEKCLTEQLWLFSGFIGIATVLIHGIVESNLVARPRIALLFWMYASFLVTLALEPKPESPKSENATTMANR